MIKKIWLREMENVEKLVEGKQFDEAEGVNGEVKKEENGVERGKGFFEIREVEGKGKRREEGGKGVDEGGDRGAEGEGAD